MPGRPVGKAVRRRYVRAMHAEEIAGARCWIHGPADAGTRIVLLHGLRGDHHGLEPIVRNLRDVRVVVPDLPGFGTSGRLTVRHDAAGYAAWTHRLLDAVATDDDIVLAGHSFGSVVAARAVAAGRKPTALMLLNPIAVAPSPKAFGTRVARGLHEFAAALPEAAGTAVLRHSLLTAVMSHAMVTTRDRALRRWIHREHRRRFSTFADRAVLLEAFHSSLRDDIIAYADVIAVPTLLVAGDRDPIAPPHTQRALRAALADAELVVLPGAGHLAHYEQPAAIAAAMLRFLAQLN